MPVEIEPQPLHEPLPGASKGATVTVEPMVAGHWDFPVALMESPGGRFLKLKLLRAIMRGPSRKVPVPAFLVRHPSAGAFLVDTGLHPSVAAGGGRENFGRAISRVGSVSLEPGEDVPAQLRSRGLDPGQIGLVVMTHLHCDHASAISEFPQATFVVSEAEWRAAAHGSRPASNGYRRAHYDNAFDYRAVDFDRSEIDSYANFGRTFDLFGDGSVHLAFTPGHSAGHMSVICRLRERDFVIGGDAMYVRAQLDGGAPLPPLPQDAHNYRRTLQELRLFQRQYPDAVITPGHDAEFYAELEDRYE